MNPITLVLFNMLMQLGPHSVDTETEAQRSARMSTLAFTMVRSAEAATCNGEWKKPDCKRLFKGDIAEAVVAQYTIGRFESYFAQHIHEDKCRLEIGECDAGLAKSVFQLQAYAPLTKETWKEIGGTDRESTQKASWAAMRALARAKRCGAPEAMFRAYGTSHCRGKLKDAKERAEFYHKTLNQFRGDLARARAAAQ